MAAASALEEVPVRTLLRSALSRFREEVRALAQAVADSTSGRRGARPLAAVDAAFDGLLRSHRDLRAAVQVLHDHQRFQERLQAQQAEVAAIDGTILGLSSVLRAVQAGLEKEVFESAKPLLGRAAGPRALAPVDSQEVLAYAHKLSYCTAAPPGWHFSQGVPIPVPFKPPAPQDDHMRASLLFARLETTLEERADSEAGLAAKAEVLVGSKRKAPEEREKKGGAKEEAEGKGEHGEEEAKKNKQKHKTEDGGGDDDADDGRPKKRVARAASTSSVDDMFDL